MISIKFVFPNFRETITKIVIYVFQYNLDDEKCLQKA